LGYNSGSSITTGTGNICFGVGAALGSYDNTVSYNIYIGNGTSSTASGVLGSIILGNSATCNTSDQLILSPSITTFNVLGLVSSTGTGKGIILEYDSLKNIIPSSGTYLAGDYTVSTVATFTSAAGQDITISGAGRGTTQILATSAGGLSINLGAGCSFKIANLSISQNGT